jgi:beta-barrel assembly-enhancing protease
MPFQIRRRSSGGKFIIAGVIALIAIVTYFSQSSINPVTGKKQHIALTHDQEVALGLNTAPAMAQQFGGISQDSQATSLMESVGSKILAALPPETPAYPFDFHLLADRQTVNAFALPGGQLFITEAMLSKLETEGQLAGVLAHEVSHVIGRHSSAQIAKSQLLQGLVGAATVASTDDHGHSTAGGAAAQMAGQLILLKYGRTDELEADSLGLDILTRAGYDPRAMIGLMKILERESGGSSRGPDFASTHPSPGNRIERLNTLIAEKFPRGIPAGLKP